MPNFKKEEISAFKTTVENPNTNAKYLRDSSSPYSVEIIELFALFTSRNGYSPKRQF